MPCTLGSIPQAAVPTKPAPDSAQRPRGLRPRSLTSARWTPMCSPRWRPRGIHTPLYTRLCVCGTCAYHADISMLILAVT